MRLVVVYLGDSIPKHFWLHVQHLLNIQSEYHLDVVTSKKISEIPVQSPRLHFFNYQPRPEITEILDSLVVDIRFRDGFWRYSLERLFALTQHHLAFPNESILHIESDLLLLRNFPFQKFKEIKKVSWSRVGSNYDVAAIVYSPNPRVSGWLEERMLSLISGLTETNDMHLLGRISSLYSDLVSTLPSTPSIDSEIINTKINISSADSEAIFSEYSKFEGIFDPAGIGIWLTGTEPRNFFGVTKKFDRQILMDSQAFINPGKIKFHFAQHNQLYFVEHGRHIPVYTLHIHSKNLDYFGDGFEGFLARDVLESDLGKTKSSFSFRILLELIIHNWQKGTLLRYLSWLPIFRRIKIAFSRNRSE
jgi:hypothetical protein